jgi:hypothetical protein
LFDPLRALGVPKSAIDVVEPFFRVIVERGYDRSIPPWEPTPARLMPKHDTGKVVSDLVAAIGEGINNGLALVGAPPLRSISERVTTAAPKPTDAEVATDHAKARVSPRMTPIETTQPKTGAESFLADDFPQATTESGSDSGEATSTQTRIRTNLLAEKRAGASELSPKSAASGSTPKPAKPSGQSATPGSAVRSSLGVGERVRNLLPPRQWQPLHRILLGRFIFS